MKAENDGKWEEVRPGLFVRPVDKAIQAQMPDLKKLAERTRARWDLLEFVEVSVKQWWINLRKR